jgi:hypothetical protein
MLKRNKAFLQGELINMAVFHEREGLKVTKILSEVKAKTKCNYHLQLTDVKGQPGRSGLLL